MEDREKQVLSRLQNECSKREYCSSDVFVKAKKLLDGDGSAASEIVANLISEKYVDDFRYASAYSREKSSLQGWGKVKIAYMLKLKSIPKEVVSRALTEIDQEAADHKLRSMLQSKYNSLKDDPQSKFKLLRYALGRGYDYDELKSLVDEIIYEANNQ